MVLLGVDACACNESQLGHRSMAGTNSRENVYCVMRASGRVQRHSRAGAIAEIPSRAADRTREPLHERESVRTCRKEMKNLDNSFGFYPKYFL